ncbi:cysteine desulfurase NifS [Firmicutes bacterium CAG:341]|mgnify:FL=1|uniref:cysteine desulfurase NifS n=1 Tax=Eubacterium sp. TaxID=142586 RepID=UPI00033B778E|nr:cysteine desulfurase NifS [Firmicutes bacterium CAG:341]
MTVYADNAATTQMSENVLKAMMPLLTDIYGNPSSLHSIGQVAKEYLENARETVADCIGADPKEIYFTSGGSEADNQAIRSAAYIGARKGKKHIISSKFEHHAVLHTLDALKKEGFTVTLLDVYSNGVVKPEDVENAITDETCLVTIMTANNEIGTIQPIAEIGKICKEKGVLFHTDAVQAVGHIPVNVKDMNVDMLSVSAHKFHGPKGVGFLYARKGILLTNIIYGGAQERSKRAGTENMASIVGMATAIKEATDHLEENAAKVTAMKNRLIDGLKGIERSRINGDLEHHLPGTLNMCFEGIEGESLLLLLDAKGICASSGSACTSGSLDPSHVLLSIGVPVEIAHGSLRLSISEYNTMEQMDHIVESVPGVVDYLRSISPVWERIKKEENK